LGKPADASYALDETFSALAARALDPSSGRKRTGTIIRIKHKAASPKRPLLLDLK
jgi:hypothetical protein